MLEYVHSFNILSGNDILTLIKGRNYVTNLRQMTHDNPNLDLVNINVYTKFGDSLSILSQDIEKLFYVFPKNDA